MHEIRIKIRAGLDEGNWRYHGEQLVRECGANNRPMLFVIDELPIFLQRMLRDVDGARRVEQFLSWLRGAFQRLDGKSPILMVSGSIGLEPLVRRLDIPDRINHLTPFRLGPWSRDASIKCFQRLAECENRIAFEDGVAKAVYERLGIGIPNHVQSFFACLRDSALMNDWNRVTVDNVDEVYRNGLLGPMGQLDLMHYETRLKDGIGDESYPIAMEILADAATQGTFTVEARHRLEEAYSRKTGDASKNVLEALDVLVHDGYLEIGKDGHCFISRLLKDWWSARFCDNYRPLEGRYPGRISTGDDR